MQQLSAQMQSTELRLIKAQRSTMIVRFLKNEAGLQHVLYTDQIKPIADAQEELARKCSEKENEIKNILNIP
jgi:hypothetical protein